MRNEEEILKETQNLESRIAILEEETENYN